VTPKELFERYVYAGLTRNADLQAEMFAPDGVESPLAPRLHDGKIMLLRDYFALDSDTV
jgi:hypothetical protein